MGGIAGCNIYRNASIDAAILAFDQVQISRFFRHHSIAKGNKQNRQLMLTIVSRNSMLPI